MSKASTSKDVPADVFYYLGVAGHLSYKFSTAIDAYKKFMSLAKPSELKKLNIAALGNEAQLLKKEFFNLKFGMNTGQVKDTSQFKKLRRQIAKVLTLAQQKQHAEKQQSKA